MFLTVRPEYFSRAVSPAGTFAALLARLAGELPCSVQAPNRLRGFFSRPALLVILIGWLGRLTNLLQVKRIFYLWLDDFSSYLFIFPVTLLQLSQRPPFALLGPAFPLLPQSVPTLSSVSAGPAYTLFH